MNDSSRIAENERRRQAARDALAAVHPLQLEQNDAVRLAVEAAEPLFAALRAVVEQDQAVRLAAGAAANAFALAHGDRPAPGSNTRGRTAHEQALLASVGSLLGLRSSPQHDLADWLRMALGLIADGHPPASFSYVGVDRLNTMQAGALTALERQIDKLGS